jgi:hypothetical protein
MEKFGVHRRSEVQISCKCIFLLRIQMSMRSLAVHIFCLFHRKTRRARNHEPLDHSLVHPRHSDNRCVHRIDDFCGSMSRHCIQSRSVGDKNSLLHHDHLRSRNHHRIRTSRERIFHRHKKTGRQNTLNDLSNDVGSNKLNDVGPCQQVWRPN